MQIHGRTIQSHFLIDSMLQDGSLSRAIVAGRIELISLEPGWDCAVCRISSGQEWMLVPSCTPSKLSRRSLALPMLQQSTDTSTKPGAPGASAKPGAPVTSATLLPQRGLSLLLPSRRLALLLSPRNLALPFSPRRLALPLSLAFLLPHIARFVRGEEIPSPVSTSMNFQSEIHSRRGTGSQLNIAAGVIHIS
jgi:hypothetical protein